jgi:small redox-active disulfide protein 2
VTEKNVFNACAELGLDADISHIFDIREYAQLGVRITPAILIDGNVVISGKVPTVGELKQILSQYKGPL